AYVGDYESPNGLRVKAQIKEGRLLTVSGSGAFVLSALRRGAFEAIGRDTEVTFERRGEGVVGMVVKRRGMEATLFGRAVAGKERKPTPGQADNLSAVVAAPAHWPSFRGAFASGVADGQLPPATWDLDTAGPRC